MFSVKLSNQSRNFIKRSERIVSQRIIKAIRTLQNNPTSKKAKRISSEVSTYRLRVGDYRILYDVYHEMKTVFIAKVDKRSRVYKK